MSDVSVKGTRARVVECNDGTAYIQALPHFPARMLSDRCEWQGTSDAYFWPTRESAEAFLAEHADKPADEDADDLAAIEAAMSEGPPRPYEEFRRELAEHCDPAPSGDELPTEPGLWYRSSTEFAYIEGRTLSISALKMADRPGVVLPTGHAWAVDTLPRGGWHNAGIAHVRITALECSWKIAEHDLRNARRDRNILLGWIKAAEDIGKAVGYEHAEKESDPATFAKRVVECVARLRAERDEARLSELNTIGSQAAHNETVAAQLTAVQGALADAGTVLAERTDGDYGASVRALVAERDALRAERDELNKQLSSYADLFKTARLILEGVQGALADAGTVPAIREDCDYGESIRALTAERDAWKTECNTKQLLADEARKGCELFRQQLAAAEEEKGRLREALDRLLYAIHWYRLGGISIGGCHDAEERARAALASALTPQPPRTSNTVGPDSPDWENASRLHVVNRDKLDAIYAAVLISAMQDPWDQESGCARPKPASPQKALEEFDALHETHIARVNHALDLIRELFASPRVVHQPPPRTITGDGKPLPEQP